MRMAGVTWSRIVAVMMLPSRVPPTASTAPFATASAIKASIFSAAVFGQDVRRALGVARRIESGICHINGPTVADEPQMPFGGVKASGYGRFGGKAVIEAFTELRWITIEGPQTYPF
jgi:hypothetical protein